MRPLRYSINVTLDGCCDHRQLGLIDEYEFVVHPILAGHGPTLLAGLSEPLELKLVGRQEFRSGAVAMRYQPSRPPA